MTLWTPDDLAAATGGRVTQPFSASGVSIDSRTASPGDLFVALSDQRDGHDFVADAFERGAAGALVSRIPDGLTDDAPLLVVDDTLHGLADLGRYARRRFAGRVIAVTGSVGKTTTKEMLRTVLSAEGLCWAAEASHNNHWGVPLTLSRAPADAAFCVVEIGMNHAGEIAPLARMAAPDVAVIVTVEPAHIGFLGSLEAIADEKAAIFSGLSAAGTAVLPAGHRLGARLHDAAGGHRIITFGDAPGATVRLVSAAVDADGTAVDAVADGVAVSFRLAAPGRHMATNALAAIAGALALDVPPDRAAAALAGFSAGAGRGMRREIVVGGGGRALLLDESYNASSASVRAALAVLAAQHADRRVAVLGDMLELGDHGPAEHRGLAPSVEANADLLFTCGPLMKLLSDAVPDAIRAGHAADSSALAPVVAAALRPGDAVLVKGSLGSRMRRIVDAIEHRKAHA